LFPRWLLELPAMIFCENLKAIRGGSTATSRAFVPSDRNMDGLEACCGIATKLNLSPNQGLFHPGFFWSPNYQPKTSN